MPDAFEVHSNMARVAKLKRAVELLTEASGMLVGASEMLGQCYENPMNRELDTNLNMAKEGAKTARDSTEKVLQIVTSREPTPRP